MKNIDIAFRKHTRIEKIRIAKFVTQTIMSNHQDITSHNAMMNTVLGLLAKGNMNCAGQEVNSDLFGEGGKTTPITTEDIHQTPRTASELGNGIVPTQAEKDKAEELRRKAEEEKKKLEEEAKSIEEEDNDDNPGKLKGFGSKIGKFIQKLISEDD